MTLATAFVEIRFELFAPFAIVLNAPKMLPLGAQGFGKTVGQAERDELREAGFIAMRQITSLMPAAETSLRVFDLWWRRPASLALD